MSSATSAALCALLLIGCSGSESGMAERRATAQPLDLKGDPGEWCLPWSRYPEFVFGVPLKFRADATDPITISAVEPVDPEGVEMRSAFVVPVRATYRFSVGALPPTELKKPWRQRRPAVGATVDPGETTDVVATFSWTGPGTGSTSAMRISYTSGGQEHVARTTDRLVVPETC